jgi:hypothetical protein
MKYLSKIFFLITITATMFTSCKKDENKVYYIGGTAPVLTASRANNSSFALNFVDANTEAIKLMWTNPNYQFTTGLSSQDVTYTVEIDTVGSNFTNPKKKVLTISKDLSKSILVSELNDYCLNQLVLEPSVSHNLEIRVKSDLLSNASSAMLISNSLKFSVTPYAIPPKVDPPTSNELFITGIATPANWMNGGDPPNNAQKFTKISNTVYELASIALTGGAEYLLVPRYGNWNAVAPDPEKYGAKSSTATVNPDGDDFQKYGNNYKAPAASGNYKIRVDFQIGKFTVTKL